MTESSWALRSDISRFHLRVCVCVLYTLCERASVFLCLSLDFKCEFLNIIFSRIQKTRKRIVKRVTPATPSNMQWLCLHCAFAYC